MKTMTYENVKCEIAVSENFFFSREVPCEYPRDTIAYAVEKYFPRSAELCRRCTYASWRQRVQKGKPPKEVRHFLIPARRLELPGAWARISGSIDRYGITVDRVELLKELPSGSSDPVPFLSDPSQQRPDSHHDR